MKKMYIIGIQLKREFMPKKFLKEGEPCEFTLDDKSTVVFDETLATNSMMFIRDEACHELTSTSHPACIMHGVYSPFTFNPLAAHQFYDVDDAIKWYKSNWNIIWSNREYVERKWFTLHTLQVDEICFYEDDSDQLIDYSLEKVKNFIG